jgi:hypothetical protein
VEKTQAAQMKGAKQHDLILITFQSTFNGPLSKELDFLNDSAFFE